MQARKAQSRKTLPNKQQPPTFAPRGFGETVQLSPDLAGSPRQSYLDSRDKTNLLTKDIETTPGRGTIVQPRLEIRAPGDKYEQEADRIAQEVVQRIHTPQPKQPTIQRVEQEMDSGENEATPLQQMPLEPKLQLKSAGGGGQSASPQFESALSQARGGGRPMEPAIRRKMEGAFGADFSGVKVHADGKADELSKSIQAKAFTTGQDIFFRQGAYDPQSRGGQELLAHELTHSMQQSGESSGGQKSPSVARATPIQRRLYEPYYLYPEEFVFPDLVLDENAPEVVKDIVNPVLQRTDWSSLQSRPDDIIMPVYDSYWEYARTHWQYSASSVSKGEHMIQGADKGMCEAFSKIIVKLFQAINEKAGNIFRCEVDESLANTRFVIDNRHLTLIGNTRCFGNIFLETNDGTQVISDGYENIAQFLFSRHWRPRINGVGLDPIFNERPSNINITELEQVPRVGYAALNSLLGFVYDSREKQPCFNGNFIRINNLQAYQEKRQAVIKLYDLTNASYYEQYKQSETWSPLSTYSGSDIDGQCKRLIDSIGDINVFKHVSAAYSGGYVEGRTEFMPMLDEIIQRAESFRESNEPKESNDSEQSGSSWWW